ncbi:MAG: response regulator [Anaerolineales bacterium]|nr:response regulator [Anaerolineales bacterium]MBX3036255.1 response regulator [Anaerolineales bacterium]
MTENLALIIEDDEDLSDIFTNALHAAGYKVEAILDGKVAEERLTQVVPKIILLDMHLPHVNGATLLKQIHANDKLKNSRIIIATADSVQAEFYRGMASIVLVKPISFAQLRDLTSRFLNA